MTRAMAARQEILVVGRRLATLAPISHQLDPSESAISVIESPEPVRHLIQSRSARADILIVLLTGEETVVELRALCLAFSKSAIIFLSDVTPLRHALVRAIQDANVCVMNTSESSLAVAATALVLSFRRSA